MGKSKPTVKRYWKRYIEEFKTSGMSKIAYCRIHELAYHQFLYWNGKLSKAGKTKVAKLPLQQNPLAEPKPLISPFVPVKLQPEKVIPETGIFSAPQPISASSNLICTFEMQQGHKVLVYSIAALERVLPLLNSDVSNKHRAN